MPSPKPIDSRLRKRAEDLARHAAADTNEGRSARRELERMVARHPELAGWLDARATEPVDHAIPTTTAAHRRILTRLADRMGVDLDVEPTEDGTPHFHVKGPAGEIHRFEAVWEKHAEALDLVVELVGDAWAEMAFPKDGSAADANENETETPESDDRVEMDARTAAWIERERQRVSRLFARAQGLPSVERVQATLRRAIAPLLEQQEGTAVRALLGGTTRPWDDPSLNFEEFCTMFQTAFPKSRRSEAQLRVLFRDGQRIHPGTKQLRKVKALTREDWNF